MNLGTYPLSAKKRKEYDDFIESQVIPDPPDELREIYEQRVLIELSHLRAEMYDSPENAELLKKLQKKEGNNQVPRNIQNPNFTNMIEIYEKINKSSSLEQTWELIVELITFLKDLEVTPELMDEFDYEPQFFCPNIDVRCCENLKMWCNYCLSRTRDLGKSKKLK